ncbi:Oidioi.mRNA.OKI2018_I69.chr1.g824.t1.cds [Oikopleura dioica]|uniref:Oidioi.mRNA.OKI2018_I69.chr1.g824.t1.cds n=1 Tax=Oikopleura dioica TaxID=34765 RepID=A0ABN7SPV9_OIKDI|nr:Oidioi.mRNA.OKI2018_I69.chr1.g824.t1.cds [Oikopleura dioica]
MMKKEKSTNAGRKTSPFRSPFRYSERKKARSKEVLARNLVTSVNDLQLNHAKEVTNAAFRVLVEQGSRAAETYLAHLEYILGGMCQIDMKYFNRLVAPKPAECENPKTKSARKQLLEFIKECLLKPKKKEEELEATNLQYQKLERSIISLQRELEEFKDKLIRQKERNKATRNSSLLLEKWSEENSESRSFPLESESSERVVKEDDKKSNSTWFPGDKRARWERPCFEKYEVVVVGDSQLKEFGRRKINRAGYNITSYSGCDILELLCILRTGALKDPQTNKINPFSTKSNRDKFQNGDKKKMMPLSTICPCCESNCMKKFTGRLVIGIGLNNALKASQAAFENQDVGKLMHSLHRDINYCMPKLKSLHFVKPIKVPRWSFHGEEEQVSLEVYEELLEVLEEYPCSPAAPILTKRDFNKDAVHLAPRASEKYWNAHFSAIECS